jgi:hypothetical protein
MVGPYNPRQEWIAMCSTTHRTRPAVSTTHDGVPVFFLVHRWNAVFGDPKSYAGPELPGGAIQKGILFYGFDATTGRFRTHFFWERTLS